MLIGVVEAEQNDAQQTWRNLLWIPPTDDEPGKHVKLHLDDELAGLIEAADMPADQDRTHPTKPEAASSVPGEDSVTQQNSTGVLSVIYCGVFGPGAVLYCSMVTSSCFALHPAPHASAMLSSNDTPVCQQLCQRTLSEHRLQSTNNFTYCTGCNDRG